MQMDAHLKKEQIGTLFVRVGALSGGRGGGVPQGGPGQNLDVPFKNRIQPPGEAHKICMPLAKAQIFDKIKSHNSK